MDIEVEKSHESIAQVSLRRVRVGLGINVLVHPIIEETFKAWGSDEIQDLRVHGNLWIPVSGQSLRVWSLGNQIPQRRERYVIDHPGTILGLNPVNISFLRLVGASEGRGVQFSIRGVYEEDSIDDIGKEIHNAIRDFYVAYLKPVDVTVFVSSQKVVG